LIVEVIPPAIHSAVGVYPFADLLGNSSRRRSHCVDKRVARTCRKASVTPEPALEEFGHHYRINP
jgi:hypothetical protein